jgi:hypothetical protein
VTDESQFLPHGTVPDRSGCISFTLTAADLGQTTLPVGAYQLQLFAGARLIPVGQAAVVHITAPGRGTT